MRLTRREKVGLAIGALALAWLTLDNAPHVDGARVVPAINTGTIPRIEWDASHFGAARAAVASLGLSGSTADRVARAFVAHWITETGRRAEWNFNVANMHRGSWTGPVYVLPGQRSNTVYQRAYASLVDGATDYAHAIAAHYAAALRGLVAGGTGVQFYRDVRAAGWTDEPASEADAETFASIERGIA